MSSSLLTSRQGSNSYLKVVEELVIYFGGKVPKTQWRMAYDTLTNRTPLAAQEWSEQVESFTTASDSTNNVPLEKAEHDLAAWLDTMHLENGDAIRVTHDHGTLHRAVDYSRVALYRCSWCRNPSAALKKCSGCEKARCVRPFSQAERLILSRVLRYCDLSCQKEHWKGGHRKLCNVARSYN